MTLTIDEKDFLNRRGDLADQPEEERLSYYREQRSLGVPHAYITGSVEFFGVDLTINSNCLIPRQETEVLVSKIVDIIPENGSVLDLCCGSGAIGLALKKHRKDLFVTLLDVSKKSLELAQKNSQDNGLEVCFLLGDFLKPLGNRKFDYIVCNPPYIAEGDFETLEKEVKNFEPKIALTAGNGGLYFYEILAKQGVSHLTRGGKLVLEIGFDQRESIMGLFDGTSWKGKRVEKDYAQNDRFFFVEKREGDEVK